MYNTYNFIVNTIKKKRGGGWGGEKRVKKIKMKINLELQLFPFFKILPCVCKYFNPEATCRMTADACFSEKLPLSVSYADTIRSNNSPPVQSSTHKKMYSLESYISYYKKINKYLL
jgi:hypothetical protein